MQSKELKQMEALLLAKKSALLKDVEERFKKQKDDNNEKLTDVAEIASSSLSSDMEMHLVEEDARELKQIEDALARIKAGHYGTCEQCGCLIKKARLKAIPFTTLCISCKEEEEKEDNERETKSKYSLDEALGNSEIRDVDEMDKKRMRSKIMELEMDDSKG
ncbi:MAG: TraR/DksA C4-type zinc finger protein [Planctomycetes bacterium]|nr:TraR/DksA C4-type zinc finger protein [Planctomycetota bacterium]